MNNQQLYELYLQKLAQTQAQEKNSTYNNLKNYSAKIGNYGDNLSTIGNTIKDNVNNELAQKFGGKLSSIGNSLSNGANTVSNTLNTPQNYFKGFANNKLGAGMQKVGQALANQSGALGTIGNTLVNTGSSLAGTGAATTGATTGAATAGTAAGTTAGATTGAAAGTAGATAAGTSAAAGTGAAAGSAAGGAAAGGSAGGASAGAAGGPIGALIALAVMALAGGHRKAAKKSGKQLMNATNQMAEQENELSDQHLQQIQQDTANLQQQANNAIAQGIPTGGAANIQNPDGSIDTFPTTKSAFSNSLKNVGWDDKTINSALNGLNLGNKEMSDYINAYNQTAADGQQIIIPKTQEEIEKARMLADGINPQQQGNVQTTEQVKQGLLDKFINGITDFSRGYQENRNTAFSPENLQERQNLQDFRNSINPADYTTRLTPDEQKQFNTWANDMKAKGLINPNDKFQDYDMQGYWKNEVLNNTDLANGNAEAHFTDKYKMPNHETFSNESIYATGNNAKYAGKWDGDRYIAPRNENKMSRLGEAVGTISRIAQNPATQAIVAGGLSTALTGNPLYGAGMAYKFGNQRQMSNIYQDVLAKNGVDVDTGLFGNITSSDMNAIMTPKYKEALNNIALAKLQETQNYHDLIMKYYNDKLEETKKNNAEKIAVANKNANARQISANASVIRANNSGKGKGGTKPKPQDNKDWAGDLAGFNKIYSDSKYADKIDIARSRFIGKYGVDPLKYIKQ